MLDKVKIDLKTTNSSLYFLPFIDELVDFRALDRIENTYLYNNNEDKQFCILYKFSAKLEFIKYEEKLMQHELYLGHEDYDEYVLYKFKIPAKLESLRDKIINSSFKVYQTDEKRTIIRLARRRLLQGIDLMQQRLDGKFKINDTVMEEEVFSNMVSKIKFKTANELHLERKK